MKNRVIHNRYNYHLSSFKNFKKNTCYYSLLISRITFLEMIRNIRSLQAIRWLLTDINIVNA